SLDTSFNPVTGGDGLIEAVAIQPDGRIVIVSFFGNFRGVVRLNPNGSLDEGFVSALDVGAGAGSVLVQPDGKLVLAGNVSVAGVNRGVVRLNSDGSIDPEFNPGTGLAGQCNAFV